MKSVITCLLLLSVSAFAGTQEQLERIGSNANLGNGGYSVDTYSVKSFNKDAKITKLNRMRFEGCRWKLIQTRRAVIAAIKSSMPDDATAGELEKMYVQNRINAMIALQSDSDISCSRLYTQVYTNDGFVLELLYDGSD